MAAAVRRGDAAVADADVYRESVAKESAALDVGVVPSLQT